MKSILNNTSTIILIILTSFLLWKRYEMKKTISNKESIIKLLKEKNNENLGKVSVLEEHHQLQIKSNFNSQKISFDSLKIQPNEYLILRVHQNDCNDCVKLSLKLIEKYKRNFTYKVIIVANFPSLNALESTFGKLQYPVILKDYFDTDLENVSKPYFFIVNERGETKNYIYPNFLFIDLFESYLKII